MSSSAMSSSVCFSTSSISNNQEKMKVPENSDQKNINDKAQAQINALKEALEAAKASQGQFKEYHSLDTKHSFTVSGLKTSASSSTSTSSTQDQEDLQALKKNNLVGYYD